MSSLPVVASNLQTSTYEKITDPIAAAEKLGEWICKSGLFGVDRPDQGTILGLQCIVEKLPPLELAKRYHFIQGRLSLRADAMLALYRERGGKVIWIETSDKAAKARFIYDGNDIEISYTADDAKAAGLLPAKPGSGWAKFPGAMLVARLTSKAVRMLCPEAVTGVYTPEEVQDFASPAKTVYVANASDSGPLENVSFETAKPVQVELVIDSPKPQDRVVELIDANNLKLQAMMFLADKKWLGEGQGIADLSTTRCEKILEKPEKFIDAVKSFAGSLA
jgi:hypothetical protein